MACDFCDLDYERRGKDAIGGDMVGRQIRREGVKDILYKVGREMPWYVISIVGVGAGCQRVTVTRGLAARPDRLNGRSSTITHVRVSGRQGYLRLCKDQGRRSCYKRIQRRVDGRPSRSGIRTDHRKYLRLVVVDTLIAANFASVAGSCRNCMCAEECVHGGCQLGAECGSVVG